MYSAYKLNKQGDNIQPWCTLFPVLSQSVVLCTVLTVASCPAHRFLRRQVRWSVIPISLKSFHSLLWSTLSKALAYVVHEAEVDVFLEFPCYLYDPMDVGNLISGFSAFSKSILYIWKFSVHILLKLSLKDFEHYLASMWNELSLGLEWKLTFSSPVATAEFSKFAGILSAALSQHHLLGFEIVTWNPITSTSFVCCNASWGLLDFTLQDVWL